MVTFTPDAYTELCQRIAAFGERDHVVSVLWLDAQLDLLRSSEGNAVWKEVRPAQWSVSVEPLPGERYETEEEQLKWPEEHLKWTKERLLQVENLRVLFLPAGSGVTDAIVACRDGQLYVQQNDA